MNTASHCSEEAPKKRRSRLSTAALMAGRRKARCAARNGPRAATSAGRTRRCARSGVLRRRDLSPSCAQGFAGTRCTAIWASSGGVAGSEESASKKGGKKGHRTYQTMDRALQRGCPSLSPDFVDFGPQLAGGPNADRPNASRQGGLSGPSIRATRHPLPFAFTDKEGQIFNRSESSCCSVLRRGRALGCGPWRRSRRDAG